MPEIPLNPHASTEFFKVFLQFRFPNFSFDIDTF